MDYFSHSKASTCGCFLFKAPTEAASSFNDSRTCSTGDFRHRLSGPNDDQKSKPGSMLGRFPAGMMGRFPNMQLGSMLSLDDEIPMELTKFLAKLRWE